MEFSTAGILEWVAMSFSNWFSQSRFRTQVSCITGRFFTVWATREAQSWPTTTGNQQVGALCSCGWSEGEEHCDNKSGMRVFLVAQWTIHLPMQETQVGSLIREDPTCHGATKPVCHNSWACALEPRSCNSWSPSTLEPVLSNKRSHCSEKPVRCN